MEDSRETWVEKNEPLTHAIYERILDSSPRRKERDDERKKRGNDEFGRRSRGGQSRLVALDPASGDTTASSTPHRKWRPPSAVALLHRPPLGQGAHPRSPRWARRSPLSRRKPLRPPLPRRLWEKTLPTPLFPCPNLVN
ncbi:hypothetical protein B296_00018400 [Ensete ventricosum]|uniref:Uncharacterized protein n=1 Tax=Ensete ventricosum TaxID=4639 RepID=A0A427AAD2_ENSVE|nr:hypothetical protein B296_00018400 [Ensete ventricosum]